MKKDISSKLETLQKQQQVLGARIQKLAASKKAKERKADLRKRFLIGAYTLQQAIKDDTYNQLVKLMDRFLTRDSDRKAFNLPPIKKGGKDEKSKQDKKESRKK